MTFTPSERGKASTLNNTTLIASGGSQNTAAYNINSGTVVSATSTTVVLDTGSVSDDAYNDLVIEFTIGNGKDKSYLISDYTGSTKTVTVGTDWVITPDTTTEFTIHYSSGICQENTSTDTDNTIRLSSTASAVDDFYNDCYIRLLDSNGDGQLRKILDYNGTTKIAVIDIIWMQVPDATTLYAIYGENGTCGDQSAAVSTTIILDGNQTSIAGTQYLKIEVSSGTGAGQIREITSLSTNTLTITPAWTTQPVSGDQYQIYGGWGGEYETCKDYSLITTVGLIDIILGQRGIIDMQLGMSSDGSTRREKYTEASYVFPGTVHTLTVISEYYRLRIIGMGTDISGTTHVVFNSYKSGKLTTFVGEPVNDSNDCELTKSVVVGRTQRGGYNNVSLDSFNNLAVAIKNPNSSFGEVLTAGLSPVAQIQFIYSINPRDIEQFVSHGTYMTMGTDGSSGVAQVQSVYLPKADSFTTGNYFTLQNGGPVSYYVWYNKDAGGGDPAPGGTGLEVGITSGDSPSTVASATHTVMNADAAFSTALSGNIVTITNATTGAARSVDASNMPSSSGSSISTTKGSSLASVTSGSGVADYAVLRSRRGMRYRPGIGCDSRFTAIFDTPVAGTLQYAGIGNSTSALYFGYVGTDFMILRKTAGLHSIQTLQITSVASATTGTLIITIDGIDHTVTLTNVTSVQTVAQQISAFSYSTSLFLTEYVNDKIIFSSERIGSTVGDNTFAFALGTATNITGTFTANTTSVAATDYVTNQNQWNIDRMNGRGMSGMVLNPQKGNVYRITYQWLGFGSITFWIEDYQTGDFVPVHVIKYSNSNTEPSITKPNFQLTYVASSTTATTPITVKTASGAMFVQGQIKRLDPYYTGDNTHTTISAATTTKTVILAIRNPRVFNELTSQIELLLTSLSVSSTKSANNTKARTTFSIIIDATPSSALTYNYVKVNESVAYIAKPSRASAVTLSNGYTVYNVSISSESTSTVNIASNEFVIQKNSTVYIAYTNSSPSTGNIDIDVNLTWIEDH